MLKNENPTSPRSSADTLTEWSKTCKVLFLTGHWVADLKHVDYVIVKEFDLEWQALIKTTITYLSCGLAQGLLGGTPNNK